MDIIKARSWNASDIEAKALFEFKRHYLRNFSDLGDGREQPKWEYF